MKEILENAVRHFNSEGWSDEDIGEVSMLDILFCIVVISLVLIAGSLFLFFIGFIVAIIIEFVMDWWGY